MADAFTSIEQALRSPSAAQSLRLSRPVDALPATLLGLTNLRSLELSPASEAALGPVLDVVARMPSVTSLRLHLGRRPTGPALGKLAALPALETLVLQDTSAVPDELGLLSALRHLIIWGTRGFSLPESIAGLRSLEALEVNARNGLARLPDAVTKLRALRALRVAHSKLTALPDGICALPRLEELDVRGCALRALPDDIGALAALRVLDAGCNALTALPASFARLALERVSLEGNALDDHAAHEFAVQSPSRDELYVDGEHLRALPDTLARFTALRVLRLHTPALAALPPSFASLAALDELSLEGAAALDLERELPRVGALPALRKLALVGLGRTAWPELFGSLRGVRSLFVEDHDLERLPASIGAMPALIELNVHCRRVRSLPRELASLAGLRSLTLWGPIGPVAERAAGEPIEPLGALPELERLMCSHATLPAHFEALPALRELTFYFGPRDDLRALLRAAPALEKLLVRGVDLAPAELAALLRAHARLRELSVEYYADEALPAEFSQLGALEQLRLPHCRGLSVPDAWPVPPALRHLSMPRQDRATEAKLVALLPRPRWSKSVATGELVFVRKGP